MTETGNGKDSNRLIVVHQSAPCQQLFLLAGIWAVISPLVWLCPAEQVPDRTSWHATELLLGVAGAAAGGYLLTSLPAWTAGRTTSRSLTWVLVALWVLPRALATVAVFSGEPEAQAAIGWANAFYFLGLALALAIPLARSRAVRQAWAPVAMGMAATVAIMESTADLPASLLLLPFVLLLTFVGGRAVPAFTAAWMLRAGDAKAGPAVRTGSALPVLSLIILASLAEAQGWTVPAAWLWMIATGVLLRRMSAWRTCSTFRYPALFWLHVAFAWVPLAFLLQGLAPVWPDFVDPASARHAFTVGAMGGMMMAMMLRPAMKRVGDRLILTPLMSFGLVLVQLSALTRVAGPAVDWEFSVQTAALVWILAWVVFIRAYWPAFIGPVPRPAFSARLG
ncbi:MAG: NnrS family protein [Pannonibacter sp.]